MYHNESMIMKKALLLALSLSPLALNAMEETPSLAERIQFFEQALATSIVVRMDLIETSEPEEIEPGFAIKREAHANFLCLKMGNAYYCEPSGRSTQNITCIPTLSSLRIDPENPSAPLIKCHFKNGFNDEVELDLNEQPLDLSIKSLELSIPYASQKTIPVTIATMNKPSKMFDLTICVERCPAHVYEKIMRLHQEELAEEQEEKQ